MGRVAQNATTPAFPALPVVSRTNHGTPMRVSEVPAVENELAARTATIGVRCGGVRLPPSTVTPPVARGLGREVPG